MQEEIFVHSLGSLAFLFSRALLSLKNQTNRAGQSLPLFFLEILGVGFSTGYRDQSQIEITDALEQAM